MVYLEKRTKRLAETRHHAQHSTPPILRVRLGGLYNKQCRGAVQRYISWDCESEQKTSSRRSAFRWMEARRKMHFDGHMPQRSIHLLTMALPPHRFSRYPSLQIRGILSLLCEHRMQSHKCIRVRLYLETHGARPLGSGPS